MIASVQGEVLSVGAGWIVVSVGGIGLRVETPAGARAPQAHVGEPVFLRTSLIVREDSLTLFGFATEAEIEVFGHLIAVSGVGPRSALGVLSALTPAEVAQAVSAEDEKPFKKVSGIGPKTAKLIAVSLAGKLSALGYPDSESAALAEPAGASSASAVQLGLTGLGYTESDAAQAVQDALSAGAPDDESGLLRAALRLLQSDQSTTRGRGR